jgi:hypothetical protein
MASPRPQSRRTPCRSSMRPSRCRAARAAASYPNGRVPTDDVYSARFAWLTNGQVTSDGLKPHDDLLAEFPYLGVPNS